MQASNRALLFWLSGAIALETAVYSAITPLLPYDADRFLLGKTAIGLLTATYPSGLIAGAVVGAVLVPRVGVRSVLVGALVGLASSTAILGLTDGATGLYFGRFCQGVSGGCMWSAALAWLFLCAGNRRGTAVAGAMSAGVVGVMIGPLLGTAAAVTGTEPIYLAAAAAAAAAIVSVGVRVARLESPPERGRTAGWIRRGHLSPPVMVGVELVLFAGFILGTVNALIPLRLADLGASQSLIGGIFFVAALVAAVVSPPIGRAVDRIGPNRPIMLGLAALAGCSVGIGLAGGLGVLAGLTIVLMGFALLLEWVPSMTLLADRVEAAGASVAVAAAVINVSIALGEVLGSPVSASLASGFGGDSLPFALIAVAALATLIVVASGSAVVVSTGQRSPAEAEPAELGAPLGADSHLS